MKFTIATIEYKFTCGYCFRTEKLHASLRPGEELMNPGIPHGWRELNDELVCPEHEIVVTNRSRL